jgi:hypothetical protein
MTKPPPKRVAPLKSKAPKPGAAAPLPSVDRERDARDKAVLVALGVEAKRLADDIQALTERLAQNVQFWADPSQEPTCGFIRRPGEDDDTAKLARSGEAAVVRLRDALAALRGELSAEASEDVQLVGIVESAADFWVTVAKKTPEIGVARALDNAVDTFSARTLLVLQRPENRARLVESVKRKLGLVPRGKRTVNQRDWLKESFWMEPIFEVASEAELGGDAGNVDHWLRGMRNREERQQQKRERKGEIWL